MSTTSTAGTTITAQQLQGVLSDYTVRLTGDASTTRHDGIESPNSVEAPPSNNPPNWPRNHYRVPDHRPVNRNLDYEERPKGSNAGEFAFLSIMFTGVYLNSVGDPSAFIRSSKLMFERLLRRFGEGLVGRMQLGANGSRWAGKGKGNGRRRTMALEIL
ncbi:hypothetical protein LARI1_G008461 [Lachnellula arida]|uniref:Uncharacterized protein n=1 Tax=Lachnellula arida TaxID=1316785 RepID=A0A8T9AYY6_9HELO|nr:hypothetical protein LARI1_G008461 [Lachnellula arida]